MELELLSVELVELGLESPGDPSSELPGDRSVELPPAALPLPAGAVRLPTPIGGSVGVSGSRPDVALDDNGPVISGPRNVGDDEESGDRRALLGVAMLVGAHGPAVLDRVVGLAGCPFGLVELDDAVPELGEDGLVV